MNITDNSPVEQLWYTWSDVGLSTIHAGFRIRAASSGLTEIYGDRVKNIERNMRYVLPPSTDRSITPDMAPIGLAFIRSDWHDEYLLIHKKYTGEDGVGRQGNFFVHALALGDHSRDFSVEDAIWQWEAPIWKTDSSSLDRLDRRSTSLAPLSIDEVYKSTARFRSEHFRQVQDALQFVIEAYLMRKNRSTPLYIAAPANQAARIATIIAGLTNCLPAQLLASLTFSTYEPDITKATTEIVGTSWISIPGKGQDATAVLPKSAYLEKLAINCETRERSNLQSHPHVIYNQLAADFAAYAAECMTTGLVEPLYSLRDYADKSRSLDVELFLSMFRSEVIDTVNMDERGIERYLNDPDLRIEWLSQKKSRKKIIDRAVANPLWGSGRLNDILLALRGLAEQEALPAAQSARRPGTSTLSIDSEQVASAPSPEIRPRRGKNKDSAQAKKAPTTLADVLTLLAKSMIPEIVHYMELAQSSAEVRAGERRRLVDTVTILLRLMDDCLLRRDSAEVWKQLFEKIEGSKGKIEGSKAVIAFLTSEWAIQSWLLKVWHNTLPSDWQEDDRMRPFLRVSWARLGDFLRLGLQNSRPQWVVFPVQELITDPNTLTPQIAKELEQGYSRETAMLLTILMQSKHLSDEANLLIRLVEKGHAVNSTLEPHIEQLLEALIRESSLQRIAKDLVATLLLANYTGSDLHQRYVEALTRQLLTTTPHLGQELVDVLIAHDFPRSWLIDLSFTINGTSVDLLNVIQYIYPTPEGQNKFFLLDGSRYLGREDHIHSMLALYQQLLPLSGKMQRLFILLDAISDQEKIFSLLKLTPLEAREWDAILQRYGQRYLQSFQQAPGLASMVVSNFANLVKAGYSNDLLFTILPQQAEERSLEHLLSAAKLTPEQQLRFLEKYGANSILHYPQMPILMNYVSTYVTNFTISDLEREETKNFFAILTYNYKNLALDTGTANKIKNWKIINAYFNAPDVEPQKLQSLASALLFLNLPDGPYFTAKLAQAFSFCIRTAQDISKIMTYMQEVPTLKNEMAEKYRLLYALATEAAEQALDASGSRPGTLTPYLVFALTMPPQERSSHFFVLFLDKLFYHVAVSNIPLWTSMHDIVEAHGLPAASTERWHTYLYRLEIWDKIKSATRHEAKSKQNPKSNVHPLDTLNQVSSIASSAVGQEKSSWLRRLRSGHLPWDRERDEPPTNDNVAQVSATPTVHPQSNNPIILPGDTRYSGNVDSNLSNGNPSSNNSSYRTYDQQSQDRR